jgi:ribosomal protein L40E
MHGNSSHDVRSRTAVMPSLSCSFCQHANPADAKYCNECGSPLNLEPCVQCEAVNDLHATRCHACGADLGRKPLAAANFSGPTAANVTAPSNDAVDAGPSRTSIVKALETVEADLATISRSEAVVHVVTVGPAEERVPELQQSPSARTHRLRPALFAAFVACALAAVLLGPRLPLPPALSHATLATTSLVPAPDSSPDPAPSPRIAKKAPPDAYARTSGGPIDAIMPAAASATTMPPTSTSPSTASTAQPVAARAAQPAPMQKGASHQVDALPDPVPNAQCSDGVAAMGLCNREGAKDGR